MRRTAIGTIAVALFVTGCAVVGPRPAADPPVGSTLVGCDQATVALEITVDSHLDPSCTYSGPVRVTASAVTLDCRGALIHGGRNGTGITVVSDAAVDMSGVTIRNCRTEGFLNGMRITRTGFRDLAVGEEYVHHLRDVAIEDSIVSDSRGVGIFVDGYVTEATIANTMVRRAGSAGIYLETGSREHTVRDNWLIDNGFIENGPSGTIFNLGGVDFVYYGTGREGLAIDGSSDNVVTGNYFHGNSAGGIFLYTNCGEYPERDRYFERRYPSDRNLIEHNIVDGGWTGVWVGSRMAENVYPMECTNPAYHEDSLVYYTLDRADDNTVRENFFLGPSYGVRVEDDGTEVIGNHFTGPDAGHHAIVVGTPYRLQYLGEPVRDTVVTGNRSAIVGNPNPYRWTDGLGTFTEADNRVDGVPTAFCEAPRTPHGPFVMALEIGFPNPDGSIPPNPDLTFPVLPPLPACAAPT
jgi:parallel beta-helix repeat protein